MLKIAYLVLAYQDPIQLERLVRAIDYQSHIFIHLDKKTNIDKYIHLADMKSVDFISERIKIYWGGFSIVKAVLNLIKFVLDSKENFSHLVLLSGTNYPIKPISTFHDFLQSNPDRQFIKLTHLNESPYPSQKRLTKYWFMESLQPFYNDRFFRQVLQKLLHLGVTRKPINNMSPAWGCSNWVITSECAVFILQYLEQNPIFMNFYKYAHSPDEHFFHTIIANSHFLEEAGGFREDIRWIHEVSNTTVNFEGRIFVEDDYEFIEDLSLNRKPSEQRMSKELFKLMDTSLTRGSFSYSSFFFARKFTTEKSSRLLDMIDNNLLS
ncbi:MAG: beta-1,6-N-acetylglucosaminyltransferase [Sphaerospermopsis kisseleviana]